MAEAVGEFLGDDAREGTESVCALGDPERVCTILTSAGFMDVEVNEVEHAARHSDVRDAIDGQLAAVPFATSIDALGPERRSELIDTMADLLADYIAAKRGARCTQHQRARRRNRAALTNPQGFVRVSTKWLMSSSWL
jgi:hypothetical protein